MSDCYIGEIRMFAGTFPPSGWVICNGQLLAIADNEALFNLIGTTYGGDGQVTFAVPDLRGRVPVHVGNGFVQGQQVGVETVALTSAHAPVHNHSWNVVATADSADKSKLPGGYLANGPLLSYDDNAASPKTALAASTIGVTGAGEPHENMAPFVAVNFIMALWGIFPSQG